MRIPQYRKHARSGLGYVRFKPWFGDNQHYLPGKYGSKESIAAYEALRAKIVAYLLEQPGATPKRGDNETTVARLLARFMAWAKGYHPKFEYQKFSAVASILKAAHFATPLSKFGPLALKECRELMIEKGWTRKHINGQVWRVREIFRWGVEHELCDASILANLKAVRGLQKGKTRARESKKVKPVKWSVVRKVLPFVAPLVAAMVRVHWITGARGDEITRMRGDEIDRSRDVWIYQPDKHKTSNRDKIKIICLGPMAQKYLAPYMGTDGFIFTPRQAMLEHAAARAAKRKTKHTPSSLARLKGPREDLEEFYSTESYRKAINHGRRAAKKAGADAPHWHPHQIRHTRATRTKAIYGVEGAQAQLGNTLQATEIYAEKSLRLAMRIARESG